MAELADAQDSGSCDRKVVQVRFLLPAPKDSSPDSVRGGVFSGNGIEGERY